VVTASAPTTSSFFKTNIEDIYMAVEVIVAWFSQKQP